MINTNIWIIIIGIIIGIIFYLISNKHADSTNDDARASAIR